MQSKALKAYTLFEIIIVLGIFVSIAMLAIPFSLKQIQGEKLDKETYDIFSYIFTEQQNSNSKLENKSYGVAFSELYFTIYSGNDLASADWSEVIDLTGDNRISEINFTGGVSEVHFGSGTFRPDNAGSITVSNTEENYVINVNAEGLISINKI